MNTNNHPRIGKRLPLLLALGISIPIILYFGNSHANFSAQIFSEKPILGPCTREGSLFPRHKFDEWPAIYHDKVSKAIQEYGTAKKNHKSDSVGSPVDTVKGENCAAEDYSEVFEIGEITKEIAKSLDPWREEEDLKTLTRHDTPAVLYEFLRVYECALEEHYFFLPPKIIRDELDAIKEFLECLDTNGDEEACKEETGVDSKEFDMNYPQLWEELLRRDRIVKREKKISRPTLDRVLAHASNRIRLQLLETELECLQRASLDIRNIAGLAAESAACMPRVWDAKDPMREPAECNDGVDNDKDGQVDGKDDKCESQGKRPIFYDSSEQ